MENVIDRFESVKDLGMIMSDDARFHDHIEKVTKKVRQEVWWIVRTFYTRKTNHMKQLWKTLVQCHIDYCSQRHKGLFTYYVSQKWGGPDPSPPLVSQKSEFG